MVQIMTAPFGIVRFRHFFIADLFCSLTKPLAYFSEIGCFVIYGLFKNDFDATCPNLPLLITICRLSPFTIRFLQCWRKFYDTKMKYPHLVNAAKYLSTIVAILVQTRYPLYSSNWFISYCFQMWATLFSLYWDYRMDWGLF